MTDGTNRSQTVRQKHMTYCIKHKWWKHQVKSQRLSDWIIKWHLTTCCLQAIYLKCKDTVHACMLSCFGHVWFFATLWTVACQTALSMGFSRQEYWIGLLFPSPGDLPDSGIEPMCLYVSWIGRQVLYH